MARVKICGINSSAAMDAAVAYGADWVGFVFAPSPRQVTPNQAETLSARHPGGPLRVGLFVDPTETQIDQVLDTLPLDILQLYTDAARAAALRATFGITVWRAVGIATQADLPPTGDAAIDGYVLDARPQAGSPPGGNGQPFDWTITRHFAPPVPWLLAGGLTPANVAASITASRATAVDVSSGVEQTPGHKDPALIAAFIAAAR